jgi:hypothetical protein
MSKNDILHFPIEILILKPFVQLNHLKGMHLGERIMVRGNYKTLHSKGKVWKR